MLAQVKASTEAATLRAKPALVRARKCCMPIASAWLLTVSMAVRTVRKPARSAVVLGIMLSLWIGTRWTPVSSRMLASSGALL